MKKWLKRLWEVVSTLDTLWSWASRFGPVGALGGVVAGAVGDSPMSTVFSIIFAFSLLSLVASFMSDMAHKKKMERYEERFYRGLEVLATLTEKDYKELSEQDRKLYEEIGELRNSLEGRRKVPLPPSYLFPTSPQDIDKDSP